MAKNLIQMKVRIGGEDGFVHVFQGRDAFALGELLVAGHKGITSLECLSARRLAHYIFKLRKAHVAVETVTESHGGPYAGTHARYILRSPIEVISEVRA